MVYHIVLKKKTAALYRKKEERNENTPLHLRVEFNNNREVP